MKSLNMPQLIKSAYLLLHRGMPYKGLCLGFFLLSLSFCSTAPKKKQPLPAPPSAQVEITRINKLLTNNDYARAIPELKNFIKRFPENDLTDNAYMSLGDVYLKTQKYDLAYRAYLRVVESNYMSPEEGMAAARGTRALYQLGKFDEALALSKKGLRRNTLSNKDKLAIYEIQFEVLKTLKDNLEALRALSYLQANETNSRQQASYSLQARSFLNQLDEKQLKVAASERDFLNLRPYAYFLLANTYFERREFSEARAYYYRAKEMLPSSTIADQAASRIEQIEARRKVDPYTVGAILPLSGRHQQIAERVLKGIQLGLGIYGDSPSDFKLAVIDSQSNPELARRGVEKLVTENHVIGIVGSLLSKTATAVATKSNELAVPNVTLSQKSNLTQVGPYIFRSALTGKLQVSELVRVAMEEKGYRRFGILYPNDNYGVEMANIFWDEVIRRDGEVRAAQTYISKSTDFRDPLQRLLGIFYLEDRQYEYQVLLREWYKKQENGEKAQPPEDLLPPIVDFDALFIPDNAKSIGQIAPMLAYFDVTTTPLLGTNLWNTSSFLKRGDRYVEGSLFVDSKITVDPKFKSSEFYRKYVKVFGYKPSIFEAQAYEAALVLRHAVLEGSRSRQALADFLTTQKEVPGVSGPIKISKEREFLQPIVSLTVKDGKIRPQKTLDKSL